MKKSKRALVGMVLLNVLVLLGAGWMVVQVKTGAWQASDEPAAISAITTTAGALIGVITAVLIVAFFTHRRQGN